MAMIGESIKRREDLKYITGSGTYVDDISLPGMLYAAFVRSPHAHAKLLSVHMGRACLLFTSDAADDTPCVDLGARRIIKK